MDRNTIIGFVLIGVLLIGMFAINSRGNQALLKEKKRVEDSILASKPKVDTLKQKIDSIAISDQQKKEAVGGFIVTADSAKQTLKLSNEVMEIEFSSLGAQPQKVSLKKYKTHTGNNVVLNGSKFNQLNYEVNTGNNKVAKIVDLPFVAGTPVINSDKSQTVTFTAKDSSGKAIIHQYTIRPNDYMIDLAITLNGANQLVSQNALNINWQTEATLIEKIKQYEGEQMHIDYAQNGETDFEYIRENDDKTFSKPLDWVSIKQQFFIAAIIAKDKFTNAAVKWTFNTDSTQTISQTTLTAKLAVANASVATVPLQLYFGPSDYNILKKYDNKMDHIVPYGSGPFSFVKYINRHFLLPIWDFLTKHIANYGMVILLLTLLIRLITSPILYKSYLSGAKMKALKPEVDALRAKFTNAKTKEFDQQGFGMEQMKLWKTAGVSPLGGCVPALLQIPIFMSLFYFFQANIDLRGKNFLWAKDLAAYDSIMQLPFNIPFYGDHVSLFTLTATVTSLVISLYSMSSMQDNTNPVMKYMPYIFPVLMLGFFNNLPAALTWYYTVSNTITLILQIIIQKWIINPEKIRTAIAENMKKPVKQSKFQEKLQAMQESQKKLQELKNKGNKR